MSETKFGFLRETKALADKSGNDKDTGLSRTGLDEYLKVIFPHVNDWIHDKTTGLLERNGNKSRVRPDYRSEKLKLIVEYDGLQHYQQTDRYIKDIKNQKFYESYGYKVVRIPYFIQLSNDVVKSMFDVDVNQTLFDSSIPSIGPLGHNSPAYLCPIGIKRMALEFKNYPEQYKVNLNALKSCNNYLLTEYKLLEKAFDEVKYNDDLLNV